MIFSFYSRKEEGVEEEGSAEERFLM